MREETTSRVLESALEGPRWSSLLGGACVLLGAVGCAYALLQLLEPDASSMMVRASAVEGSSVPVSPAGVWIVRGAWTLDAAIALLHIWVGVCFLRRASSAARFARVFAWTDLGVNLLRGLGVFLVSRSAAEIAAESGGERAGAMFTVLILLSVSWYFLLWAVWPVALLVWLSRDPVRAEVESWTGEDA